MSSAAKPSGKESSKQNKKRMRDEEERKAHDIEQDVAKMVANGHVWIFCEPNSKEQFHHRDAFSRKGISV